MDAGLRIDSYAWAGGREAMLRFGREHGPVVTLALPLFEEANRTRAFGCAILRALAAHGIRGALPELPGQGESVVETARATLADLRAAFATAADGSYGAAIRSGALLHGDARLAGRWLLAPQGGEDLRRELARIAGRPIDTDEQVEIAGNLVSHTLIEALSGADAAGADGPVRIVRLGSDPRRADRHIAASPLWRRAEPGDDLAFVQTLASDIADWIVTCGR